MTNEHDHDRDETRLQELLRSVDADAPAADAEVLRELRQRAAAAFDQAAASSAPFSIETGAHPAPTSQAPTSQARNDSQTTNSQTANSRPWWRQSMLTLVLRGSIALTAAATLLVAWLNPFVAQPVSGAAPFSRVLHELRGASTLLLQLDKSGQTSEIVVRAPGLVRKQETPQRYQIAAGSRWWKIDESENTVQEADSPWFLTPDRHVDLLGLLEVGITEARPLLAARPVQRADFHGRDCLVYRVELPGKQGQIQVEAFADAVTYQLAAIIARDAAAPADGPPLAELRLVALNQPVGDEQFAVAGSLTEDGRIGKIGDAQGIVVLRPMLARRWTPVCRETLLRPGDWLRTELRGANAARASLTSGVELTLGPGTLLECISPTQARLHTGQVQVGAGPAAAGPGAAGPNNVTPAAGFTLLAPRTGSRQFKPGDKQLVRVDRDEKLVDVPVKPVWLAGFEGTTSNESLGSLIVSLPDGRNEPLSVGYHKVTVEIRDQIARTTIEESFVNHTPARLEGVFHFPLPQDASISGFGMWIGNDLVEADVVEKQRAREIFETILREKRDPGLLEWMGGNIFKARVFPIEAHSEKRIRITYTQVLPLRANRYRYSYGLRSELLRTKPLRELSLTVTVNSALPLKSVSCPTHTVRTLQTAHSAQVEFAAQEYTPTRDFEVVFEADGKQSDLIVVPHRRGDDGYLLVQLMPPAPDGNWQRELLPDGDPVTVVLLCDTSSSMDSEKRRQQAEFVGTVLTALGEDDRFQLACADVGTAWLANEPLAATPDQIAHARAFLEERVSLGWTNLDRAFADVIRKGPPGAHVIYIGDGIVSAGSTDPAAFVQRLRQLVGAAGGAPGSKRTFHSVTVGNSHESVVLKGIAAAGGGSTRTIDGEQTPHQVALELLNEIAQPGLRDLNVEFRGLKVAAVYPERLPNLPAGTQQILVGRYLPEGKDQSGEIIVTGLRGTEKVRYAARVGFKDAEQGNSFIPRLWARAHLDQLLGQGQSSQIRDQIISLSEQFHIITPYTSLLVLESDADRERFGVKRRYEMRDGERFFAEGRSAASFELAQAQMKRAGDWRLGLRRQFLEDLKKLGRDTSELQQLIQSVTSLSPYFDVRREFNFLSHGRLGRLNEWDETPAFGFANGIGSAFGGGMGGGMGGFGSSNLGDMLLDAEERGGIPIDGEESLAAGESDKELEPARLGLAGEELDRKDDADAPLESSTLELREFDGVGLADERAPLGGLFKPRSNVSVDFQFWGHPALRAKRFRGVNKPWSGMGYGSYDPYGASMSWFDRLFPALPRRPAKPAATKITGDWPPEAIALSNSLLRTGTLQKLDGGIDLRSDVSQFDPGWNRRIAHNVLRTLYSPSGWLTRPLNPTEQTLVNYCTPQERGVYSLAFLLGRRRAAVPAELSPTVVGLGDFSITPLHEMYPDRSARIEPDGDDRVKLILTTRGSTEVETIWIDTARHVVVKQAWHNDDGRVRGTVNREDFVEVAGSWWARKSTHTDGEGRVMSVTTMQIAALAPQKFGEAMDAELATRPTAQFISLPFAKLRTARQAVADGSATFDDRLAMILHDTRLQQWEELWKQVDALEKLAVDKPGARWIRTVLLAASRKNEEARTRLLADVRDLAARPRQDELFLAEFILGQAQPLTSWPEFLELVQAAKGIYQRQPAELEVMLQWTERLAQCHEGMNKIEEILELRRSLAEAAPWHLHWQTDLARRLSQAGRFDEAHAWLRRELERPMKRSDDEDETLRVAICDLYRAQGRWPDLLKFTTEAIERKSGSMSYNSVYAQHLSALVFNDQLDQARLLAQQWMEQASVEGKLAPDQRARLEAALNLALGNAHYLSIQRLEDHWLEPLTELARFFVRHPHHADVAARVMNHSWFQSSDAADRLRGEFFQRLRTGAETMSPGEVRTVVDWTLSGRMDLPEPIGGRRQLDASEIPAEEWNKIAATLRIRWQQAREQDQADRARRRALGDSLHSIYSQRFHDDLLLPFLRERIAASHPDDKQDNISTLFEALLTAPWNAEIEQEAFARLRDLSVAPEPIDRLMVQVPALYRLVDAMVANHQSLAERQLGDQGELNTLTRRELAAKKGELRRAVRVDLAARLGQESKGEDGPLAAWLKIEQAWLLASLGLELPQVNQVCWQVLGDAPPPPSADVQDVDVDDDAIRAVVEPQASGGDTSELTRIALDSILKQRALTTVMNLAVRRTAPPDEVDRVFQYIDAGIAQGANAGKDSAASGHRLAWRNTRFRLLVALDRPDDLDRQLREWIRDDVSTAPWRQTLARLVAERGKLDEAIQLFEACRKDKLLSAADYRLLAGWYLAVDRRADYERSRVESYLQMPEGQLNQWMYQIGNRWQRQDVPLTELDENTLFAFKAIFEKSPSPEHYLWQLRQVYTGTRDFRLLQMLPDAVLGRSPQQIYAFLQELNSQVLYELRNEAAADEIIARIAALRQGERTVTDLRALDLLEALVERKSSELLNQPGPHIDACRAALRRAFERPWGDGEPVMMSSFLHRLGTLPPTLAEEQLRELKELRDLAPALGRDRLRITSDLCSLIGFAYQRLDEALREMELEVRGYAQAHDGTWPHADDAILGSFVSLYERAGQHAAGEQVLLKFLSRPENAEQLRWIKDRLLALYNHALENDGAVSLGSGRAKLFAPIYQWELKRIDESTDESERYGVVTHVVSTIDTARRHKLAGAVETVQDFAFVRMPAILKRQTAHYRNTVVAPTNVISELAGPKVALRYIVERMEQFPQRMELAWENSWQTLSGELAARQEHFEASDLAPRILKLTIRELERHLRTGEDRGQRIFNWNDSFWKEKADQFARAAEEVWAERKTSGRRALAVAQYFWRGLLRYDRAIEILFVAHQQGLLDESAQVQLVNWLFDRSRYAESIPLLETLMTAHDGNITYRTRLMRAYFHAQRPQQLTDLLQKTHDEFHKAGRWTEGTIADLGRACFDCQQYERAVQYQTEAIALHQRANPGALNDSTLADYYRTLAEANSALGRTREAVDAASAAIVCWSTDSRNRAEQLNTLNSVLGAAKDLDDYVTHLDAEAGRTGQDSPVLRKAIGLTYQAQKEFKKGAIQLRLALELQPHDAQSHQSLIACYDALEDGPAATKQLLKLIDMHRHDLALYRQLADRLQGNEVEAERAATSIIEASPNEAENHQAMAELRQQQQRWSEAIPHWEQVAELRKLEPDGLLKLAEAQIHEKQWDAARATVNRLHKTDWPARFADVRDRTTRLESQIPKK